MIGGFRGLFHVLAIVLLVAGPAYGADGVQGLQSYSDYAGGHDITGWYMSEKLDGIRGYWDGDKLLTRSGERIHAPEWFTDCLPDFELDGELWAGRGRFHLVHTTVLDREPSEDWRQITYNVFEVPHASGDFPARLQKAKTWFEDHNCPHVRVVRQRICSGPDHLQRFVQRVRGKKGEGVIVKEPKTFVCRIVQGPCTQGQGC